MRVDDVVGGVDEADVGESLRIVPGKVAVRRVVLLSQQTEIIPKA